MVDNEMYSDRRLQSVLGSREAWHQMLGVLPRPSRTELETKVHTKVRNQGEGFHIILTLVRAFFVIVKSFLTFVEHSFQALTRVVP